MTAARTWKARINGYSFGFGGIRASDLGKPVVRVHVSTWDPHSGKQRYADLELTEEQLEKWLKQLKERR